MIVGLSLFVFYSYIALAQKEMEYKNLSQEYSVIEKHAKQAESMKKEFEQYKEKILYLVKLMENQPLLSHSINDLGTYIPKDSWISDLTYGVGKGFSIKGYSLTSYSVAKFVNELVKSRYFKEIKLEDNKKEGNLFYFTLTGKFSFE